MGILEFLTRMARLLDNSRLNYVIFKIKETII